tara:strand:- start:1983 stop:2195 length:213 start_codon:yes stop_codon:yes gene_type:complete
MNWISINERMPNIGQKLLILIDVDENIEKGEYLGGGSFKANWCSRRGRSHCYKVTHWMLRPESPINNKER